MIKNAIHTGFYARANQNGLTAKYTKTHLVCDGKPLCGYVPHKTMEFQMNAMHIHLPYLECKKCEDALKYHYVVESYDEYGRVRYYAKFMGPSIGIQLVDVLKDHGKMFDTIHDADLHGKRCVRLYKKFLKDVSNTDVVGNKSIFFGKSKFDRTVDSLKSLSVKLNIFLDDSDLPGDIKGDIKTLKVKVDEYKLSDPGKKLRKLSGKKLGKSEILRIVTNATSYNWKSPRDLVSAGEYTPEDLKEDFGILVNKKDISVYLFTRNANGRDELDYIEIVALPGYTYVMWSTDRVSDHSVGLIKNAELTKYIKSI